MYSEMHIWCYNIKNYYMKYIQNWGVYSFQVDCQAFTSSYLINISLDYPLRASLFWWLPSGSLEKNLQRAFVSSCGEMHLSTVFWLFLFIFFSNLFQNDLFNFCYWTFFYLFLLFSESFWLNFLNQIFILSLQFQEINFAEVQLIPPGFGANYQWSISLLNLDLQRLR